MEMPYLQTDYPNRPTPFYVKLTSTNSMRYLKMNCYVECQNTMTLYQLAPNLIFQTNKSVSVGKTNLVFNVE